MKPTRLNFGNDQTNDRVVRGSATAVRRPHKEYTCTSMCHGVRKQDGVVILPTGYGKSTSSCSKTYHGTFRNSLFGFHSL